MSEKVYLSTNDLEIPIFEENWSDDPPAGNEKYETDSIAQLQVKLDNEIDKLGKEFGNLKNHFQLIIHKGQDLHVELDSIMDALSEKEKILNSKKSSLLDFISNIQS